MATMFWGLKMEPGKRYSTIVDKSFHISNATLDASTVSSEHEIVSVVLEENGGGIFLLTNLRKRDLLASNLDLNFMTGDNITLYCKGQGVVHLSGYMVPDDEDELSNSMLDEEAEEEEEDEEVDEEEVDDAVMKSIMGMKSKKGNVEGGVKRKQDTDKNKKAKKKKLEVASYDSDEESSDDNMGSINLPGGEAEEDDSDLDEEDDVEEGDMEEESEDDEDEEEVPILQQNNKQKKKLPQSPNEQQQNKKAQKQNVTPNKTPNGIASPQQKQMQAGKKEEAKKGQEKQKQPQQQQIAEVSLTGGVKTKDLKVGNGPPSKPGKFVSVYYTGRLKSNGKVFDSVKQGPGFKFKVGKGEVIKGWDIGVAGMKPGGKRIITCPPQVAYGQKGSPPQIPPNSTLVFEVELLAVH